ncbi:transcriptional regulatory protein SIN3-like isoform X2 [Odontomachus brunneus]|uniref:transcriptional regulatory protein SIN3-like isoform X2 n=1 Tax=Odontomachus brunneus TaxID=486640 RepID=UPI0013F25713|nr:transcriptional regulatory protein SIN3-like isoform X2 [Odontomachus brunneus]
MQPSHNLVVDGGGDFEYNKKIIVEDMLLHLHQIKYTFRNKPEVYYCLLDVINDFKSTSIDTLNIAQSQLYELLLEHFEAIMSFATFFSPSYETEEHLNHPEYDFEVSIVLHDLTETDIATLSLDQNIAARSSILIKRASCLHILQRCFSQPLLSGGIADDNMSLQYFTIRLQLLLQAIPYKLFSKNHYSKQYIE